MKDNIQRHVMVLIFAAIYALVALLGACFVYAKNKDSITQLTQRIERVEQRQLDLIKYNDCFVCHEEGKRCELINGVVWEWEEGE